jgi:hypothetical protein
MTWVEGTGRDGQEEREQEGGEYPWRKGKAQQSLTPASLSHTELVKHLSFS